MKTQLLCSFSEKNHVEETMRKIDKFYDLSDRRFFLFENVKETNSMILTYNVNVIDKFSKKFPYTISIHRKKKSGTLYTLNAMNRIIEEENGGVLDKTFDLDWEIYRNCLIITSDNGYRIIELRLVDIISV